MAKKKDTKFIAKDLLKVTRTGGQGQLDQGQRIIFKGLGLTKNQKSVLLTDTNSTRGMLNKVIHWVDVQMVPKSESEKVFQSMEKEKIKPKPYRVIR